MNNPSANVTLILTIDDSTQTIAIPEAVLTDGEDFFSKMDSDMDKGWQMSREWVEKPSTHQRCQIAADKMLDAINRENETLVMLMAGYIKSRMPAAQAIDIDTAGDMNETEIKTA